MRNLINCILLVAFKIKLMWSVFRRRDGMFVKTCGVCHGIIFDVIEITNDGTLYDAKYKCRKCGALGQIHEEWIQPQD